MISRIIPFILFSIIAITFIAVPYFSELTLLQNIFVLFMIVFNCYWVGYYLADVKGEWRRIKKERNEKQFAWYYKMGLLESAYMKEPKYPKQRRKLYMRGILR